jgi:CHAT domain-containing protein
MNQFYAGIASSQDPVAAMHNAKLALIHTHPNYTKPYYWAPFQVYLRTIRK